VQRRSYVSRRVVAPLAAAVAVLLAVAVIVALRVHGSHAAPSAQIVPVPSASSPAKESASISASAAVTPASSSPAAATAVTPPGRATASAALAAEVVRLAAGRGAGSTSIAALNLSTGASYNYGATGGMLTGSIVKVYILETLLLQEQGGGGLSSGQLATATRMIENSDNSAAETLFYAAGARPGLLAANARLGMTNTIPGPSDLWGLTQTCAGDYISLLRNLVVPNGPLTPASQAYVLGLMRNVEADQRWGVGVVADAGTDFANKNGWLAVDDDDDLWLVNSVGVLTVHGQQVLAAVLTQHDHDFDEGIDLVQSLARTIVPAVVVS
jgi:Beta-lactamase enzyme family